MRILMVGDVVGKPGRRAVRDLLAPLRRELGLHLVVANAENAAGGRGLTPETAAELLQAGADVLTTGNHIWDKKEMVPVMDHEAAILRPLNFAPGVPGRGYMAQGGVLVVNLIGRTFLGNYDCPFRAADRLLQELPDRPPVVLVDFHAEATSEKQAMGWYLAGRVSAVVGTHTHVPTADPRVLPGGTAYVTDVGMVGPRDSVLGDDSSAVIERFLTLMPNRLPVAGGPVLFCSVLIDVDEATGRATAIQRIDRVVD